MAKITQTFTASTTWTVPNNCFKLTELFIIGGGGGGGGGFGNGGGGGAGGQVVLLKDIGVTPGQQVSIIVGGGGGGGVVGGNGGAGGASYFGGFGGYGAAGGGAGITNGGGGGSTSSNIFGVVTNYSGNAGGGGAGAGATATGKTGARGYSYNGVLYGAGGGGGIDGFTSSTARPIYPGPGGPTGGGRGGGEDTSAAGGDENAAFAGTDTYGAGGGGGAATGTATEMLTPPLQNPNPATKNKTSPATPGARGGSGVIILSYDTAEFTLTPSAAGIKEGDTITIGVKTAHVTNGAIVSYTLSGTGVTADDFTSGSLSGTFTVSSADGGNTGTASIVLTATSDAFTEISSETVTLSLNNGLAVTSFLIGDWSQNPLANIESKSISATDYNTIRNKVVKVLGTSTTPADYGWGQLVQSSAVAEGVKVGATEWSNLRYDIINAWVHLYNATPSLSSAVQNSIVRGNYLDSPYSQYDAYANVIEANRFGINPNQSVVTTEQALETTWPGTYGSAWNTRAYSIITVTWGTASEARHFFNSGGEIRFTSSRSGGSATNQNAAWTQILSAAGTQAFGGAKPLQGSSGSDGKNYYRLTNSYQTWYEISASSPYSANRYRITARSPNVTNNNSGTAPSIQFQIEWLDDHAAQGGTTPDSVDGTLSLSVVVQRAISSLQPAGAGTFNISAPTITVNEPPRI